MMRSPRARREGAVETGSSTAVRGSRLVSFADGWGRGRRKPLEPFVLAHRDGSPTTLCQLSAPNFSRLPAWMTAATTLHLPPFFFLPFCPLPSPSDGPFQVFVDRLDTWGSLEYAVLVPCQTSRG